MPVLDRQFFTILLASALLGLLGVALALWGNPENSGICISCFLENSAGALGLHANERMQYLRPELLGFILGALASALAGKEFRSRGGSAPLLRLLSGIFLMVGCAAFIGCPIKLFLRLTAGDLTSLAGLAGLVLGVWVGLKGLAAGVGLTRPVPSAGHAGFWLPLFALAAVSVYWLRPEFIHFSTRGSGAQHAPVLLALGSGLVLGGLAQRSRFCVTGSLRDTLIMGRRNPLLWGLAAFVLVALVTNVASGQFRPGLYGQPGAHHDYLWSFLGMLLVGWLSVLIGGCPFRQLIKAGEGDADAGLVVVGMLLGAGLVQAWGLAATAAGVPLYGKIAVLVGLAFTAMNVLLARGAAE